jgi:hypothetical protein
LRYIKEELRSKLSRAQAQIKMGTSPKQTLPPNAPSHKIHETDYKELYEGVKQG